MSTPDATAPVTPAPEAAAAEAHPRFAEALRELGLDVEIRRFPEATRTAAEADGAPVLVLMDGSSRVDVELVRRELGAGKVKRAGADLVRETTGYAIGGVPPFGHRTKTRVLADRGLLDHDVVWAAAGTPHTVFPLDPKTVIGHAGGTVVDVREQTK